MFDKKLVALLEGDKKYIVYIVLCNLCITLCNITMTFSICRIVNNALIHHWSNQPFYVAGLAIILRFILSAMNGNFSAKLGSHAKEMLRKRIYDKVAKLGVRQTNDLSLASLTQVGIEGVEQLDLYYSMYIPQFFYSLLSPLILFVLLMFICKPSAIILLCCVPLIPMSIVAVSKYAKKIFAKYWGQYTKMGDAFLDNISGMKELKIFRADGMYHDKMNEEAEEFRKITMKVLTMQLASTTIMDLVAYAGAGLGIAIAIATRSSIHPVFQMEIPALLLFIVLIAVDFFLPLRALGSAFHVSMNGATAGKKILALLETEEPEWGNEKVSSYEIEMKQGSFGYTQDRMILNGVDIQARPGQLIGIVGSSGSGKSTILSLLAGYQRLNEGQVLIGGKDIHSLSRNDYYSHMDLISYNTYLFNDTIRNNFKMAKSDITDEEIHQRLRQVELDELSPDYELKEGSTNLSGGQRQRLALAIHLASDKEILFFDEVTSNIDKESEAIIVQNIYQLAKEKTILMVSHRLKNFEQANWIYVLDQEKIVEQGNHDQLMDQKGLYHSMFTHQKTLEEGYLYEE